jgi:hypothetical protein
MMFFIPQFSICPKNGSYSNRIAIHMGLSCVASPFMFLCDASSYHSKGNTRERERHLPLKLNLASTDPRGTRY